jgi:L-methionine (R)-S-oxide reductase
MSTFDSQTFQYDENFYNNLCQSLKALISTEPDFIAQLSNASALLFHHMHQINWLGFYLVKKNIQKNNNELVVGPFQGKPACTRIAFSRGVCGKCASTQKTVIVSNVHEFEGHIACDFETASEIVLPLLHGGTLFGVLDIDSPVVNRFSQSDANGLALVASVLEKHLNLDNFVKDI